MKYWDLLFRILTNLMRYLPTFVVSKGHILQWNISVNSPVNTEKCVNVFMVNTAICKNRSVFKRSRVYRICPKLLVQGQGQWASFEVQQSAYDREKKWMLKRIRRREFDFASFFTCFRTNQSRRPISFFSERILRKDKNAPSSSSSSTSATFVVSVAVSRMGPGWVEGTW